MTKIDLVWGDQINTSAIVYSLTIPNVSMVTVQLVVDSGDGEAEWEGGSDRVLENLPAASVVDCSFGKTDETILDVRNSTGTSSGYLITKLHWEFA